MPRTAIKGEDILDGAVGTSELADGAVTCEKLAAGLCDRLLSSASPIGRVRLPGEIPAHTDVDLPDGLSYASLSEFMGRLQVFVDGQLMFNLVSWPPADPKEPSDFYPGSDGGKIKFSFPLKTGTYLQAVLL